MEKLIVPSFPRMLSRNNMTENMTIKYVVDFMHILFTYCVLECSI